MVKIGEETGELEKMLRKIADFYEDEVDASIQSLTSIIEPLMMILVGLMVSVIIIAMYLPMFKMLCSSSSDEKSSATLCSTWSASESVNCGKPLSLASARRDGRELRVTERGKPVAVLVPVQAQSAALRRLTAQGRLAHGPASTRSDRRRTVSRSARRSRISAKAIS